MVMMSHCSRLLFRCVLTSSCLFHKYMFVCLFVCLFQEKKKKVKEAQREKRKTKVPKHVKKRKEKVSKMKKGRWRHVCHAVIGPLETWNTPNSQSAVREAGGRVRVALRLTCSHWPIRSFSLSVLYIKSGPSLKAVLLTVCVSAGSWLVPVWMSWSVVLRQRQKGTTFSSGWIHGDEDETHWRV